MSTALHESPHPEEPYDAEYQSFDPQRLKPVGKHQLKVTPVTRFPVTDIRQVAHLEAIAKDPVDEYEPSRFVAPRIPHGGYPRRQARTLQTYDRRYRQQLTAIKKLTQTIGAAFIEAELGIRPYMQLSAWMELELFHKLRIRVEHSVNEKYMAARRGEEGSKKIPSIETLGVRAESKSNGEWESSMTIRVGQRARAIAMRLQMHRDRWRVIAFEVG